MTHVFQFSRLLHLQWRTNPAVAMARLIVSVYKRRAVLNAQNADVAPTIVGVAYLRFMKNTTNDTCALYTHHRHICALQQNLIIHKSLFCQSQTLNFVECDPGHHKTTKYRIWVFIVVRKCDSGDGINVCSAFLKKKQLTFTHCTLTVTRTTFTTPRRKWTFRKCRCGWCLFAVISFSLEDCACAYCKHQVRIRNRLTSINVSYHRVDSQHRLLGQGPCTCAYQ